MSSKLFPSVLLVVLLAMLVCFMTVQAQWGYGGYGFRPWGYGGYGNYRYRQPWAMEDMDTDLMASMARNKCRKTLLIN
uniref:Uncharacterized protein n=1 Tax=Ditylenchus dipsaci TaxID=166011 RepID=A0A915CWS6_9BILA